MCPRAAVQEFEKLAGMLRMLSTEGNLDGQTA